MKTHLHGWAMPEWPHRRLPQTPEGSVRVACRRDIPEKNCTTVLSQVTCKWCQNNVLHETHLLGDATSWPF